MRQFEYDEVDGLDALKVKGLEGWEVVSMDVLIRPPNVIKRFLIKREMPIELTTTPEAEELMRKLSSYTFLTAPPA